MNKKLVVGEKIVQVEQKIFTGGQSFYFSCVEKIDGDIAILENGDKICAFSEQYNFKNEQVDGFGILYGGNCFYQRITKKIINDHKIELENIKISRWFNNKEFNIEDKRKIYNLLSDENN